MKTYGIIVVTLLFLNCGSQNVTTDAKDTLQSECPSDGKCSVEWLLNKSMAVKADQFGSLYYQILDSPSTSVVIYRYDKNVPEDLQDANYREEIVFEIKNSDEVLKLEGKELQQTKMLFGRFCFCRGQTGSYTVEEGKLNVKRKDKTMQFDLDFTVTKVPQTLHFIQASVK